MSIPDIPEKDLLTRCIRGDKQAWDHFVLKYSKLVRHALYQPLKHKNRPVRVQDLDDLHQEVFVSLMADGYRKLRQFRGKNGCSLASWIRMIAVRKAIDYMRRGRSARPAEQNPGDSENSRDYSDEKPDPEEELINSEEKEIIAEAVKRLPPRYQLFIELFYHRDLPVEEIAQIMKLQPNGIYQLHHRIKERMREILSDDYPELRAP